MKPVPIESIINCHLLWLWLGKENEIFKGVNEMFDSDIIRHLIGPSLS